MSEIDNEGMFDEDSDVEKLMSESVSPLNKLVNEQPIATADNIPPELIAAIKAQVVAEMQDDDKRKEAEDKIRREAQRAEHEKYVTQMKASPDPWVEIEGWAETPEGVKVELEWNDAFVTYLQNQGITGSDEDQVVQKWIALLMQDMSMKMGEKEKTEFE